MIVAIILIRVRLLSLNAAFAFKIHPASQQQDRKIKQESGSLFANGHRNVTKIRVHVYIQPAKGPLFTNFLLQLDGKTAECLTMRPDNSYLNWFDLFLM